MKKTPYRDPGINMDANGGETLDLNPNLDALVRAEGAPENPSDMTLKVIPDDLPNLDAKIEKVENKNENQNQNQNENGQQQQEIKSEDVTTPYDAMIDALATKYGEKFHIEVDGLDETNVFERIEESIARAKGITDIHPEAKKLQDAINAGVKIEDYYKQINQVSQIETMDPKELVKLSLKENFGKNEKRPNGWDDQKIEDTITKMDNSGYLELEAEKIRANYTQNKEQLAIKMTQEQIAKNKEAETTRAAVREAALNDTIKYFNQLNDINGVPLEQSEKLEFANDFKYLITPDPKTGNAPLYEALQSNETLAKVAWFLRKGDAGIRKALTLAKEGAKKDFLGKLDKEPKIQQNRGTTNQGAEIDLNALAAPAQN